MSGSIRSPQTETLPSPADSAKRRRTGIPGGIGLMLGLGMTACFYLTAPAAARLFSGGPDFVQRYFCGHPLEYVTSTLFFVGLGILSNKLWYLPTERRCARSAWTMAQQGNWASGATSSESVMSELTAWQSHALRHDHRTSIARRVKDVLHYVSNRRDGAGLEDHLRYLADLAADRHQQSYSLIRTITWAIPIMGFLGTVVGITMAIANVTPEQLDSSLPEVTSGLAVAFDTTAQALGMSMLLVFSTFLVERGEQSLLNDVEQFGIDHLLPSFVVSSGSSAATGVPAVIDWTTQLLAQQSDFWNQQLTALQTNWSQTLVRQTDSLAAALNRETEQTLETHRENLNLTRDQYASSLVSSTAAFTGQLQNTMSMFAERVESWQQAMQASTISSAAQTEELHRLGRTLLQMTESEQRLMQLQEQLNRNLQALQIVETLEQTVNSLNAAVSLLSAKTTLRAVA